jgi:hypothetical protein
VIGDLSLRPRGSFHFYRTLRSHRLSGDSPRGALVCDSAVVACSTSMRRPGRAFAPLGPKRMVAHSNDGFDTAGLAGLPSPPQLSRRGRR